MEFAVDIKPLSDEFFTAYPCDKYPELMAKAGRPYTCLFIDICADYFICIPFRSNIRHKNAYLFKFSERSRKARSGLDYSKIVLIRKPQFLAPGQAVVDQDEYSEAMRNIGKIIDDALKYIRLYTSHARGEHVLPPAAFARQYAYCTLPYFHDILDIPEST